MKSENHIVEKKLIGRIPGYNEYEYLISPDGKTLHEEPTLKSLKFGIKE